MKKIVLFCLSALFFVSLHTSNAQCTFTVPYGSATINSTNQGYSVTISTCQWAGEVAVLNFNVNGAFLFSSSNPGDYLTLSNSTNSVIAFGPTPLNAIIPTTGTYYLHTAASGTPVCATQNTCRTTRVLVPVPPCAGVPQTGTPSANPSMVCPNSSATITLPGVSTGTGLFYQWLSSTTGSLGLYGVVPGASAPVFTTAPTATSTTWYKVIVACGNSAQTATSAPVAIDVAATTTNTVPYFEGFENLIADNQLPNCSWKASNLPQTCQTNISTGTNNRVPRSGSKFASFYYLPSAESLFYTNGIYLKSGVSYSASAWYITEQLTYPTWLNLSLLIGPNQSTLGLQTVASTNGAAASPNYKSISNTFTVAGSGMYYLAIRANSSGSCCAQYLSIDDIEITAPCVVNTPTLSLAPAQTTICQGSAVLLSVSGADAYVWSNGAGTSSVSVSPFVSTSYTVVGTNSASACSASLSYQINVFPTPQVNLLSPSQTICAGEKAILHAIGASSYTWNNGFTGNSLVVNPTLTTIYSVTGSHGSCQNTSSISVSVLALPNLVAVSNNTGMACAGSAVVLIGTGANSYTWSSSSLLQLGNPVIVFPEYSTTYTLSGTGSNGCKNTTVLQQLVNLCTDIDVQQEQKTETMVYPNPGQGEYTVYFANTLEKEISVSDVSGRILLNKKTELEQTKIDLSGFQKGIYFFTINTLSSRVIIKVIKQ